MAEPYDLRSNIKDKPGSQGTLFQVKDKGLLNPQQRWPRGYTPERQAAVKDALKDTPIVGIGTGVYDNGNPEAMRRIAPEMDTNGNMRFADYPQTESRVVGALARSTVPVEHLAGITRIHNQPERGHAATYWPGTREIAVKIHKKDRAGEGELIHEVGHHVDYTQTRETAQHMSQGVAAKVEFAGLGGRGAVQTGIGEGVADNYYVEHYRGPGRKREPVTTGHYEDNFEPSVLRKKYPGYTHARPPKEFSNLSGAQFQGTLF